MAIYDKLIRGIQDQTFLKTIVFIFASGLSGELPFMPLLCLPGWGAAVTRTVTAGWQLPGQFPHLSEVPHHILWLSLELLGSSCLQCFFRTLVFTLFLPREGENIQCLSIRSGKNLKCETKIPVHTYAIFATLCAFWASIQNK